MTETPKRMLDPRQLALSAIFAAVICAATLIIRIPVPATSGYINLGDSMIFVSALLFGSRIGGVAGGLGSALADILGGFGSWAPFTLIIKGTEGFVAGKLAKSGNIPSSIVAVIAGGCVMIAGYFLVETVLYGIPAAIAELPGNIFQAGSGLLIAIPLSKAIEKAMPERFL